MVLPKVHLTTLVFPVALALLLGRRLVLPRLRYLSLAADYLPLLLLLAIATTGIVMRHLARTDVTQVKQLTLGLAGFSLVLPSRADTWLCMHVFLVGLLLVTFPLGKLMHMPGVLLSPTLTMANVNRVCRHINVRNPKVEILHYADYEAAFRERMVEAGLPVEKE
jgi:nitrate reductase gamma subunit